MNQLELERQVIGDGVERRIAEMKLREGKGRAGDGPYSNLVYRQFVVPVADAIKALIIKPGRGAKFSAKLAPIGSEVAAYTAVRVALTELMQLGVWDNRRLAYSIGKMVYSEAALERLHESHPELLWMLTRDLDRRGSVQEAARCRVLLRAANTAGIELPVWDKITVEGVGNTLYWLLLQAGLIVEGASLYSNGRPTYREVMLSEPVMTSIMSVRTFVAETTPMTCPTIEPPVPWTEVGVGGFHGAMRRAVPFCVQTTPAARGFVREAVMPTFYAAINSLQATGYRVNKRVLDIASTYVQAGHPVGEFRGDMVGEKPARLPWMDTERDLWSMAEHDQFDQWKKAAREWHTRRKIHRESVGRVYNAIRQGNEFADYPSIYFVHFADTRGRLYCVGTGLSTQGTDLQKALLEFDQGKPLDTPDALAWFLRHGANKFGIDKVSREEQLAWVTQHAEMIKAVATNPLDNTGWTEADSPFGFLAWCFEFLNHLTPGFVSRLPIGMDGTCNGLQHFSALLRDGVGGKATNLLPSDRPQDIYSVVAAATLKRITEAPTDEHGYRKGWLALGISRAVMKRPVMTTPYGVTRRTATAYVANDYLATAPECPWEIRRHIDAANWMMNHGWPAIGDVVVAAREAMEWLYKASYKAVKAKGGVVLAWRVPSGFYAHQSYAKLDTIRIDTIVYGHRQIRVGFEIDEPDGARHRAGMAPNFVHSLDAAHLHRTCARASAEGITHLMMVHDDYACHAADAEALAVILRDEFVTMYSEHDPLAEFAMDHPVAGKPPAKGTLDIAEVRNSPYFFN